jgi:hypothetical protein
MEPLVDRRRLERRREQRRRGARDPPSVDRRCADRRVRQRRESVTEHLRNALQVLLHVATNPDLPPEGARDLWASARRIWLALQELERATRRQALG